MSVGFKTSFSMLHSVKHIEIGHMRAKRHQWHFTKARQRLVQRLQKYLSFICTTWNFSHSMSFLKNSPKARLALVLKCITHCSADYVAFRRPILFSPWFRCSTEQINANWFVNTLYIMHFCGRLSTPSMCMRVFLYVFQFSQFSEHAA